MTYSNYLNDIKSSKAWPLLAGSTPSFPKEFYGLLSTDIDPLESRIDISRDQILNTLDKNLGYPHCELTIGASQALFQVLWHFKDQFNSIAIELPYYEPYYKLAKNMGYQIENIDVLYSSNCSQINIAVQGKAKIALISNPHFFFGTCLDGNTFKNLLSQFDYLILDEVFMPQFSQDNSFQNNLKSDKIIRINSLSKSFGLSYLRFGWISAEAKIIDAIRLQSLFLHVDIPTHSQKIALKIILRHSEILNKMKSMQSENRKSIKSLIVHNPEIFSHNFDHGHFGAIKLPKASAQNLPVLNSEYFGIDGYHRFRIDTHADNLNNFINIVKSIL